MARRLRSRVRLRPIKKPRPKDRRNARSPGLAALPLGPALDRRMPALASFQLEEFKTRARWPKLEIALQMRGLAGGMTASVASTAFAARSLPEFCATHQGWASAASVDAPGGQITRDVLRIEGWPREGADAVCWFARRQRAALRLAKGCIVEVRTHHCFCSGKMLG